MNVQINEILQYIKQFEHKMKDKVMETCFDGLNVYKDLQNGEMQENKFYIQPFKRNNATVASI